uniref:Proteasome activator PA28 C-terminal domain-containing protein n=1 Tax=Glossina brevipalpis TaxID=37001 RepID=A0A1A9WAF3_9MUSC
MFYDRIFSGVHQDVNISGLETALVSDNNDDDGGDADNQSARRARMFLPTSNAPLCEMIEIIKPITRKLAEDSNFLKMYRISFTILKVEDENSFEVSLQKSALVKIQAVRKTGPGNFLITLLVNACQSRC